MPIDAAAIGTVNAVALDPATRRHYLALVQRRTGQHGSGKGSSTHTPPDAPSVSYGIGSCWMPPTLCRGRDPRGGLAFCKIHHAAYDSDIVGVRPDGVAQVRRDVLEETDGPMLQHGLQEVHGARLLLPRAREKRPSVEGLEKRWERFRAVG